MSKPKYELLKQAYAIIDGVPEEAFDLRRVVTERGESLGCGTIACAAGWLAMHPKFQAKGLTIEGDDWHATVKYKNKATLGAYTAAMGELFRIPYAAARALFDQKRETERGTDKEVWKKRIVTYLRQNGQL